MNVTLFHPDLDRHVTVPDKVARSLRRSGWVDADQPPAPDPDSKEALQARAAELGLTIDSRWGAKRLAAAIEAAEAATTVPEGDDNTPTEED